jgi:hypothetical protein
VSGARKLLIAALVLLAGALAWPVAAQHQVTEPSANVPPLPTGEGTLHGRVSHDDGRGLAHVDVALYALAPDGRPGIGGTKTDAEGRFVFEGVSNASGVVYLVGVRYGEIPFGQRAAFAPGAQDLSMELRVSDPVADASALLVMQTVVQTEWIGAQLFVQVVHHLRNPDDRVLYVPEAGREATKPLFRAALPTDASDFLDGQSGMGSGLSRDGDTLTFWGPVYPGDQEVRYGFLLDGPGANEATDTLAFALPFPAGSGEVSLLVPESDPIPHGERIPKAFVTEEETGTRLRRFDLGGVGPNEEIALAVELPESSADAEQLSITRADLWIDHDDTAMRVNADYTLRVNTPIRLLAEPGASLMHIALPPGAEFLGLSASARARGVVADDAGGLSVRGPIPHGESSLGFKYRIAVEAGAPRLDLHFDRSVAQLNVLVADNGVVIETDRLHRRRPFKQGTRVYLHNEAFQIASDETISIVLTPLTASGLPRGVALACGLAAAALATFVLVGPLRASGSAGDAGGVVETALSVERASLYDSIHDLDHDYETGKLEPADFERMRAELRAEAVELLREERRTLAGAVAPPEASGAADREMAAAPASSCPGCAGVTDARWQFCSHCGHDLRTSRESSG